MSYYVLFCFKLCLRGFNFYWWIISFFRIFKPWKVRKAKCQNVNYVFIIVSCGFHFNGLFLLIYVWMLQRFIVWPMILARNLRCNRKNIWLIIIRPSIVTNPTAGIMVILILFHSGGFRCFKHYYKEYVCKHLIHLFPRLVSYNRFVGLEKEVLLPMTIFIKKVLLGPAPVSVLLTLLLYVSVVTKEFLFIRHLRDSPSMENV